MRWSAVCKLARRLPEVEDGRSYGVQVLRVRGSFLARLVDEGRCIVVKVSGEERAALCARRPQAFAVPADDPAGASMTVRLSAVEPAELWPVLVSSWRRSAPATLVAAYDAGGRDRPPGP